MFDIFSTVLILTRLIDFVMSLSSCVLLLMLLERLIWGRSLKSAVRAFDEV